MTAATERVDFTARLKSLQEAFEGVTFWLHIGNKMFWDGKDTIPGSVMPVHVRTDKHAGKTVAIVDEEGRIKPV